MEVLGEIVFDADHQIDVERFDSLMEQFYPSLEQFYQDIKGETNVTSIDVEITEGMAIFSVTHGDNSQQMYMYDRIDQFDE